LPAVSQSLRVVHHLADLRAAVAAARRAGRSVGLVPTMGALHAGHLSLVDACRRECGQTVVSVFVNPTQFAPGEDFDRYPRPFAADLQLLTEREVDLVFAPSTQVMYPPGSTTQVDVGPVAEPLEGRFRPGHFRGVATVVLKLFHQVAPDVAFFGRKDYQQSLVVRRMTADLNLPIEIRVCPTIREADGLALSSRNVYLNATERRQALTLSRSLRLAKDLAAGGERNAATILHRMHALFAVEPDIRLDYIALADPDTLADLATIDADAVALIAARVGATRLIDNETLSATK
jgi:pantoate--beta-alanine ligase